MHSICEMKNATARRELSCHKIGFSTVVEKGSFHVGKRSRGVFLCATLALSRVSSANEKRKIGTRELIIHFFILYNCMIYNVLLSQQERNIQTLKAEIKEKLPDTPKATNYVNHSQNEGKNQMVPVPPTTNLTTPAPGGETLKRSHKKNRPPPPPPLTRPDLEIRAPSALLVGVPETLRTQWRHAPLVLVTGSVMYVANVSIYLYY